MRAGIAFGSNLGDRLANLRRGRAAVGAFTAPAERASRVYETEPVGTGADAEAFLNAVLEVEFHGQPLALLDALQGIEADMGRPSKRPRNAPRTLDLDILYLGNLALSNHEVVIPHPRLHQRRFVLAPLPHIRPDLVLPAQQRSIGELLAPLTDPPTPTLLSE